MILERNAPVFDANTVAAQVAQDTHAAALLPWRLGTRLAGWLGLCVLVFAAFLAVLQSTWWRQTFGVQSITLSGDTQYHSASGVLTHLQTKLDAKVLQRHYWNIDLGAVQQALESMPWVKSAQVQRVFPNQLKVHLSAHKAAARWEGLDGVGADVNAWMVSTTGVVFDATGGETEGESLPLLRGERQYASDLLNILTLLNGKFAARDKDFLQHTLVRDALGLWQSSGETHSLVLGGGSAEQILARADRFVQSWDAIADKVASKAWARIDLRHKGGAAIAVSGLRLAAQTSNKTPKKKT